MPCAAITNESISRSFRTALLLAGDVAGAENALLAAIQAMASEEISEEALFQGAIRAALASRRAVGKPGIEPESPTLPVELRQVLRLRTDLRHCFVLRILASLSRADCAQLLNISVSTVDERTCEAARKLAANRTQASNTKQVQRPYNPFSLVAPPHKVVEQNYATS
jgi:DNA-binding NarL/FixJ family response regulator